MNDVQLRIALPDGTVERRVIPRFMADMLVTQLGLPILPTDPLRGLILEVEHDRP